jgi:hypothetical protein
MLCAVLFSLSILTLEKNEFNESFFDGFFWAMEGRVHIRIINNIIMKPFMCINTIKDALIVSFSTANLIKSLSFKKHSHIKTLIKHTFLILLFYN